jgi:hypothetical protein
VHFDGPLLEVITGQQLAVPLGHKLVDSLGGSGNTVCSAGDGDDHGCGGVPVHLGSVYLYASGIWSERWREERKGKGERIGGEIE